jgi:16S rRNA G527 N7-methylase RsmG
MGNTVLKIIYNSLRVFVATDWTVRDSNPGRKKKFSFLRNVQTDCGAQNASYSKGTGVLSGSKVAEA